MSNNHSRTILFLLVNNMSSGGKNSGTSRSGLLNSATMTAAQITKYLHYKTKVEVVPDANHIYKEIDKIKPDIVILEAIWATPAKVKNLTELYPKISFITRVHSEVPFLSHENNAIAYIKQLSAIKKSYVAFNSVETEREFFALGYSPAYLPNIYSDVYDVVLPESNFFGTVLDVGCFGSIRPFKNQLLQALSAIVYCKVHNLKLRFHINSTRVEQQGGCVLGNIRALFVGTHNELVEHPWLDRKEFLELVNEMDLGMQVSFNETFNIVSADFVMQGVPIVVSNTINWMPKQSRAQVDSMDDIMAKMAWSLRHRDVSVVNNIGALENHNEQSLKAWNSFLKSI